MISCEMPAVRTSFAMLALPSSSTVASVTTAPLRPRICTAALSSATHFEVSNEMPHFSKSLPRVEGPPWPPICIIGFCCCWLLASMSLKLNGSTHAMRRPPLITNWSMAKSVFSERSFGWMTTSAFTSGSIDSASFAISRRS